MNELLHLQTKLMLYENEILDIIYSHDKLTTSDLQGAIQAIVYKIYQAGKKDNKKINKTNEI
jgi:hypothetical protein